MADEKIETTEDVEAQLKEERGKQLMSILEAVDHVMEIAVRRNGEQLFGDVDNCLLARTQITSALIIQGAMISLVQAIVSTSRQMKIIPVQNIPPGGIHLSGQ